MITKWTADEFWQYVGGLAGEWEAGEMRRMMHERGLTLSPQVLCAWQPIETAPKDEPIILGWRTAEDVELVGEGYWDDGFGGCVDQPAYPAGWCIPSLNYFNVDTPTLWQRVPALPRAERGIGK